MRRFDRGQIAAAPIKGMALAGMPANLGAEEQLMQNKFWLILAVAMAGIAVSGCVPVAIGAAGVVVADEAIENDQGGDGLF